MKVWVALTNDGNDKISVHGVFVSKEKAEACANKAKSELGEWNSFAEETEFHRDEISVDMKFPDGLFVPSKERPVSEIDVAWKRVEYLLECAYHDGEQAHDQLIHIDKITEIQTALAELKKMLDEDQSA